MTTKPKLLKISSRLLDLSQPAVMGVLNLTPDSFYSGSRIDKQGVVLKAAEMLQEGATFLDIGGYSTRPGAEPVSLDQELDRVCEAISLIRREFADSLISVDTFRPLVAASALDSGANMVNDISGGSQEMFELISLKKVPYILMHCKGTPQTMQSLAVYDDVVGEVFDFLNFKLYQLRQMGIADVIVDPGFGFAKTIDQNFKLLSQLDRFELLDAILMVAISRKSMIYKTLKVKPEEALNGTTVLHTLALSKGAQILRVHDVWAARETVELVKKIRAAESDIENQ